MPHLFNSFATRYGVIGAVFAMISALFCVMVVVVVVVVVVVGSAAAGREVRDEPGRIRRGERPPDDKVQRQWGEVTAEAGSHWQTLREQMQERRRNRHEGRWST